MPNETSFLNDALAQIGQPRITAIDDGSVSANHCQTLWPPLRQAMLRSHHWNFAEARIELAQNVTAPTFEWAYAYDLPADLLKVKEVNGGEPVPYSTDTWWPVSTGYKIEGRQLLSNDGIVKIVYVKDVENPDLWDALFYQAAAAWLASKLAMAIAKNAQMSQALLQQAHAVLLPLAMTVDGQEMTTPQLRNDTLTWGRW